MLNFLVRRLFVNGQNRMTTSAPSKQVDFEDPQSLLAQATESATLAWDHQPSANISLCTPMQNKDGANHCNTADIPHVEQSLGPDLFDFLHE